MAADNPGEISGAKAIGAALATARQARGWSLSDVSGRTRVRVGLVERMESGDFSGCGGSIYARGHLRSIAAALEVDAEPLVAAFNREFGAPAPVSPVPALVPQREMSPLAPAPELLPMPAEMAGLRRPAMTRAPAPEEELADAMVVAGSRLPLPAGRRSRPGALPLALQQPRDDQPPPIVPPELREPRRPRWAPIVAVAAVIVILVLSVAFLDRPASSPSGPTSQHKLPVLTPSSAAPAPSTSKPPLVAYAGVNVRVRMKAGPSWLSVSDETGAVQLRQVLPAGTVRDFRSPHQLSMIIGNAGAVEVACNGRYLGVVGTGGQVVRLVFALNTPECGAG